MQQCRMQTSTMRGVRPGLNQHELLRPAHAALAFRHVAGRHAHSGSGRLRQRASWTAPRAFMSENVSAAGPSVVHSSIDSPPPIKVPKPRSGPILGPELGELHKKFKKLQNGSDIRGIALDGVPNEPVSLTVGAVFFIGVAFAKWLKKKHPEVEQIRVAVGRDPRLSGPMMESALAAGLASQGVHVLLSGLATTPCMFYSILSSKDSDHPVQGAIMITASHMPWNANGLKFFVGKGGLEKTDITELLQLACQACAEAGVMLAETWSEAAHVMAASRSLEGAVSQFNFLTGYASSLRQLIIDGVKSKDAPNLPLLGFKIVVDAGNGSGGFFATQVLAPLGADITGSRFLDPDGSFPNHPPNPEHPAAMASGSQAVTESKADLGIVFDTDVDRSAIVDRHGQEINSNRFIALMSAIILRDHPATTIVTDSVTSNGLTQFIAGLGGKHFRFKRGYKNVISKGVQLNAQGVETHLMMETSGHGAVKENHYLDDGAFLAVQVVIEAVRRQLSGGGDISELLASLPEPLEKSEIRIRVTTQDHGPVGQKVVQAFHDWVVSSEGPSSWKLAEINHEGWRVDVAEGDNKQGWALLRQSLHDPLLVLNVESELPGGAKAISRQVLDFMLKKCSDLPLDLSSLKN